MNKKLLSSFGLILCLGLALNAFGADRFIVCEELYSEG